MNRKIIVNIAVVLVCASNMFAGAGTTAVNFLKIQQGSRAAAMGGTNAAFSRGPESLYWNPAGLGRGVFNEVKMIYNDWIEDVYCCYAAYRHNIRKGGVGFAVTYLDSGDIIRRDNGRELTGLNYKMTDLAVDLGVGLKMTDNLNAGVSVKYISETIDAEKAQGVAAGFGLQYHKMLRKHYLNGGVAVMNMGSNMGFDEKFPLPMMLKVGVGDELYSGRIRISAETNYHFTEERFDGGAGVELRLNPFLDVRFGYKFGQSDVVFPYGLTAGFGIRYIEKMEYLIDYAISTLGDLGYINRIGFGVRF